MLVGNNPASEVYVRSKAKAVAEAGMTAFDRKLPATTTEAELLAVVDALNEDPHVHGILVQLPLPPQIDAHNIISAIDPAKDVDGFHPINIGRLASGLPALVPCTPMGCVMLAKTVRPWLAGLEAVVVGRSNIVGKPVAQLLLTENATVTIAHSKTRDLPRSVPARRSAGRRHRPAGDGPRRLDQARRHRHRRRHQSRAGRRRQSARSSATSRSTKRPRWPAPSRRCPAASGR